MSRSKELVKNTAILTVGKMCTQFISFFLLPLYTTILDPNEYGVVDLFNTYIALLLPLVCWQFDQGIFRFMLDIRGDKEKTKTLFSSVFITNLFQCAGLIIIYFFLQEYIKSGYEVYILICVILNVISGLLMQFARGLGKMLNYSIGCFLTATGTVVLNILFIVIIRLGVHGMFIATIGGVAINCIYLFFSLKIWKYLDVSKFDKEIIKEVGKYSFPLIPNQISGWILSASDRTIVSYFIGVAANGIYSVANKFSNLIGAFYGFFNLAWVEIISIHFHDEDRNQFISEMIEKVLGLFLSACVGVMAILPFVFPIMIDQKYQNAYQQIPILLVAVIFQIIVGLYSSIYIALKKSTTIAVTTIVGAIVNVVINFALIKFIGLYAASTSTLISYATVAFYRIIDVRKYLEIHVNKKFVFLNICAVAWTSFSYYINNNILNVITLILVVFFAFTINKEIIVLMIDELKLFIKKQ